MEPGQRSFFGAATAAFGAATAWSAAEGMPWKFTGLTAIGALSSAGMTAASSTFAFNQLRGLEAKASRLQLAGFQRELVLKAQMGFDV